MSLSRGNSVCCGSGSSLQPVILASAAGADASIVRNERRQRLEAPRVLPRRMVRVHRDHCFLYYVSRNKPISLARSACTSVADGTYELIAQLPNAPAESRACSPRPWTYAARRSVEPVVGPDALHRTPPPSRAATAARLRSLIPAYFVPKQEPRRAYSIPVRESRGGCCPIPRVFGYSVGCSLP